MDTSRTLKSKFQNFELPILDWFKGSSNGHYPKEEPDMTAKDWWSWARSFMFLILHLILITIILKYNDSLQQ